MLLFFGGTFDPPHRGHLLCAQAAAAELGADRVQWVPTATPPHRGNSSLTAAEDRARMVELAIGQRSGWSVNRLELERAADGRPSYTWDSLEQMRRQIGPDEPICLLLGADQFGALSNWHRAADIPSLAHLAVLPRPGSPMVAAAHLQGCRVVQSATELHECSHGLLFVLTTSPRLDIAASDIRTSLADGQSPGDLSPAVLDYIRRRGLYGWTENVSDSD